MDTVRSQCLFRTAYSAPVRVAISFTGPGRTKQSFKDECDINRIMARYMATGVLEHAREQLGRFEDVTAYDFREAMDLVAGATTMFHALPSALRERFGNDPARLLEFVDDPANHAKGVELGLFAAEPEVAGVVAAPPAAGAPAPANTAPAVSAKADVPPSGGSGV